MNTLLSTLLAITLIAAPLTLLTYLITLSVRITKTLDLISAQLTGKEK